MATKEITSEVRSRYGALMALHLASEQELGFSASYAPVEAYHRELKANGVRVLRGSGRLTTIRKGDMCVKYENRFFIGDDQ